MKQKLLLLFTLLAISANVYSQRIMRTYRNGNIVKSMFVSDVDSVKFGIVRDTIIASGTTGDCIWTLTEIVGIVGNYTLTISGNGAMADYGWSSDFTPWSAYISNIKTVIIQNGVTHIGTGAFYNHYNLTNVTISGSVITIGDQAFIYCLSLTDVTIPASVITIGNHAFLSCYNLVNIVIPNSVITIGNQAFAYCYNLTSINVDDANSFYSSTDGILFNKDQTTLIQYPAGKTDRSYVIPNSVTTIGTSAFGACDSLNDITIPNSVTTIYALTFTNCIGLTNVTIPNSVTTIGWGAFSSCDLLNSVTIGSSVDSIGYETFKLCYNLTTVINLNPTPQNIVSNVFSSVTLSNCTLKVPVNAVSAYQAASVWSDFGAIVDLNNPNSSSQPGSRSKRMAREPFTPHYMEDVMLGVDAMHNFNPQTKRPVPPYHSDGEARQYIPPQHFNGEHEVIRKQINNNK
ncbi:MAG: leucine-rich repeat domain-containing protein [Bacteroidales bacterium]|jgi:hypothetical protein|nr:leucine-rich repeat domain-containing protein [Bacteroidales bacterium]